MPDPSIDPECWLFPTPLEAVPVDSLINAVRLHAPQDRLPRPERTVAQLLAIGDWLIELSQRCPDKVELLTDEKVVSPGFVKQRMWLSRKIPVGDPLRQLSGVPVGHLRALASLDDREPLVDKVQSGKLSVRQLLGRLERTCHRCNTPLPRGESDEVVGVTFGRLSDTKAGAKARDQRRKLFCSARCARDFLNEIVERGDPQG